MSQKGNKRNISSEPEVELKSEKKRKIAKKQGAELKPKKNGNIANKPKAELKPRKKGKVTGKPEAELEAFSECPIKIARNKLGMKEFRHRAFSRLKIDTVPLNADELKNLYNSVHRAWLSRRKDNWNEAKARVFVDRVLESVVLELLAKFKTEVEDEASVIGKENHGRVDMAIVVGDAILLVAEIKASCIHTAIA
jgi:hypothetical protein